MSPPPPALVVDGLEYRYPDGRAALRGVSFSIEAGETVALVGPNGAGKSTLLLHLNGILPGEARRVESQGHSHALPTINLKADPIAVRVDGLDVAPRNFREVRRRVGLLFQDPDDQLFGVTVLDDVAFGPLNLGMSKAEAKRVALECLDRVALRDLADRPPHHLSFGERKRACLAGILACRPSVLVLDEPSANLDPRGRRRFMALIRELDATKLIATHDLDMAVELCPRTILLDGGKVAADGPTVEILSDSALVEAHGLEVPRCLA